VSDVPVPYRLPLLALGLLSLIAGVGAGLLRLGWQMPLPSAQAAAAHGPLMICGFFGTLISLERAVALGRRWAYLGPVAAGLGGAALMAGLAPALGRGLLGAGSAVLCAASVYLFGRQRALFTFTLAAGAGCWLIGNLLWLAGLPLHTAVPWWIGFLVLTIAGERLELSRFLPPSVPARRVFALLIAVLLASMAASAPMPATGTVVQGAALLALALWLLRQDVARRTVRERGLTRFIAVCLLSGYVWLGIGGAVIVGAGGLAPGTAAYDAAIHALMLGFVFSMVFGHAPIIGPSVVRARLPYHPVFYVPLAILHLSLALRLAGDATGLYTLRSAGGILNALALLAFIVNTVAAVIRGRRAPPAPPARG